MGYNWLHGGSSGSSIGQIHSKNKIDRIFSLQDQGPGQEQDGNSQGEGGESDWDYKGKMLKRDLEAMSGTHG